jgi:hypothetical protein
MSRDTYNVELGFGIDAENGDLLVQQLAGAAIPGGDTGPQDDSPIGSTYQRTNGEFYTKIADANATADWELKSAGNNVIMVGYTPANGDVTVGDTYDEAFEKLDGNQRDLTTAAGIAQGATDMGTYTGNIISDNVVQTVVNQELESAIEAIKTDVGPANIAQNVATVVDSVLVDDCQRVEWEVTAHDIGTPANVKTFQISGFHNGHAGADATLVKDKVYDKSKLGGNFNLQSSVTITGAAGAQAMNLVLETSDTDGIRYTASRVGCVPAL